MKSQYLKFSGVLLSMLFCCAAVASSENLALEATATCKDKPALHANDGDYATEWDGESRNLRYGRIDYPILDMKWDTPRLVNKIVIYDRPGLENHATACAIKFDDNSAIQVYAIPNDAAEKTVVFEPRKVKELTVQVVNGIGEHSGFSELEAYYDPEKKLFTGRWVEANDWQGTFGVSHDIAGLAALMGGPGDLAEKLNYAFEKGASSDFVYTYNEGHVSYANQPGCSNAHVFNHAGFPWLSQKWVRRVSRQAYGGTDPNTGYGGHDEDQGQMGGVSALMKIGLFSLRGTCSKEPIYEITAPEFDEITIQLDPRYYPGKAFKIVAHNNGRENVYIQKASLNGHPLANCWIYHKDFAQGGLLELWLGPIPNKQWGRSPVYDQLNKKERNSSE